MIPKSIHQIWLGDMPPDISFLINTIKLANRGYRYTFWNLEALQFSFPEVPENVYSLKPAFISDIFRYKILQTYGGIYVDCDFEGVKSFDSVINNEAFVGAPTSNTKHFSNAIIGSEKNGKLMTLLVSEIEKLSYKGHFGPTFLTNFVLKNKDIVSLYSKDVFYPYYAGQTVPLEYPPLTIAVHHWHASWLGREDLSKSFKLNMEKIRERLG